LTMENLSERCKNLRKKLGYNQGQLGDIIGVGQAMVSSVEKGEKPFGVETMKAFSDLEDKTKGDYPRESINTTISPTDTIILSKGEWEELIECRAVARVYKGIVDNYLQKIQATFEYIELKNVQVGMRPPGSEKRELEHTVH